MIADSLDDGMDREVPGMLEAVSRLRVLGFAAPGRVSRSRRIAWPLVICLHAAIAFAQSSSTADAQVPNQQVDEITSDQIRAQRKSIAIGLLDEAKRAATRGDEARAMSLARKAAEIPTIWDAAELTPERFLRELERRGGVFADSDATKRVTPSVRTFHGPAEQSESVVPDSGLTDAGPALIRDELPTPPEAFRRAQRRVLDATVEPDLPTANRTSAESIEEPPTGDSNRVEVIVASSDAPADASTVELLEPFRPSSDRIVDVRVHDFSSARSDAGGQAPSPFVASLTSLMATLIVLGLVLSACAYLLLRVLAARGGIVVRIEIGSRRAQHGDATNRTRLLRLASIPGSPAGETERDRTPLADSDAAPRSIDAREPLECQGPRNPQGGAAA